MLVSGSIACYNPNSIASLDGPDHLYVYHKYSLTRKDKLGGIALKQAQMFALSVFLGITSSRVVCWLMDNFILALLYIIIITLLPVSS